MAHVTDKPQTNNRIHVPDASETIAAFLSQELGFRDVVIDSITPLSGGAIQENWLIQGQCKEQGWTELKPLVLRTDSPSAVPVSMSRPQEYSVLSTVHQAGVKVPTPISLCRNPALIGRDFFLME